MRIFINGFGRIGRTIARIVLEDTEHELVGINDIVDSPANLAYLLKYDSNYGRLSAAVEVAGQGNGLCIDGKHIPVFCKSSLTDINWQALGADVVIDASGVQANVEAASTLRETTDLLGVVVTHSPTKGLDRTIIMGVNEGDYQPAADFVVSSSICDANAVAHPLKLLDEKFGVVGGSVTTLHPWLGYQNLTDAAVAGQSDPGHYWPDFSLGRSSVGALIPKNTTAVKALAPVLPEVAGQLNSFSYRIPTAVVTSADMTILCQQELSQQKLEEAFEAAFAQSPYVALNHESLISVDYEKNPYSAIVDMQWLSVSAGNMAKIVVWYDNEWGYAQRAIDTANLIYCGKRG